LNTDLVAALGCAIVAILYGAWSVRWVLAQSAGNARMQEIAGAIQEGAQAYLNRQYTTIGIVGVVLFVVGLRARLADRGRLRHRRDPVGGWPATSACSFRCAPTCAPPRRAPRPVAGAGVAFRGGAITGMLVVGLGLLGVAGYYWVLLATGHPRTTRSTR
jgi:K(+)-stimulated pyrophosphate-energized sodium pump